MTKRNLRIAVIGAGASGIATAIKLKEAGIETIEVFEKAADLGGTWRDNTYPGLTCDVPSHLYRYSFAPNAEWVREYATGPEILAYLRGVAEDFDVVGKIHFNSEVTRAEFANGQWDLRTVKGEQGLFDVVISAVGVLHCPIIPDIAGRDDFKGIAFHSTAWRHDIDYAGKRVGIIGSGSTSVQIIPALVDAGAEMYQFQRTAQWMVELDNKLIPEAKREAFRNNPDKMQGLFTHLGEVINDRFASALVGENPEALDDITQRCQANLANNVHDTDLRARLTPDFKVGCKRLVVSSAYYPAMQKPNAHLIDTAIDRIEAKGIRTSDGVLHELDILIYATGFDTFNFLRPMQVIGVDGQDLNTLWDQSSEAYRSVAVPGFPNLFFIGGPNSPIGNFSFLMTAEIQLGFVMKAVEALHAGDFNTIAPKMAATAEFNAKIKAAMPKTIWATGGCDSWYVDKTGTIASWPWSYERFRDELETINLDDFEIG